VSYQTGCILILAVLVGVCTLGVLIDYWRTARRRRNRFISRDRLVEGRITPDLRRRK